QYQGGVALSNSCPFPYRGKGCCLWRVDACERLFLPVRGQKRGSRLFCWKRSDAQAVQAYSNTPRIVTHLDIQEGMGLSPYWPWDLFRVVRAKICPCPTLCWHLTCH